MSSFQNILADIFGLFLIVVAIVLAIWETVQQRRPDRDCWFVTRRRFRRRMLVSLTLAVIGFIISLDARDMLPFSGLKWVIVYAGGLGFLALLLIVLALYDFYDTVNSAARKSLAELEQAVKTSSQIYDTDKASSDTREPS